MVLITNSGLVSDIYVPYLASIPLSANRPPSMLVQACGLGFSPA